MLSILALLYGAAVLTGVQAECQTTTEGYTWSFQADRDEMLLDIPSSEACLSSCFNDPDCSGYTWLTDVVVDICYNFQVLEGQHTCYGCHSGTVPTIFHEEACKEDASHLIAVVTADSSDSCYFACLETERCTGFTWYNQLTSLPYYCFLYGECVDTIPCLGCSSGILNCIGQSSTTASPSTATTTAITSTTTTTTTTTLPVPNQCQDYKILDDSTRNVDHGPGSFYCDADWAGSSISPDWRGDGYYRIQPPAGDKIPTSPPGDRHCGTDFTGYIIDEEGAIEQMEVGQEITVAIDFCGAGNCGSNYGPFYRDSWYIKVTKCPGNFFVYYLSGRDVCEARYCASF